MVFVPFTRQWPLLFWRRKSASLIKFWKVVLLLCQKIKTNLLQVQFFVWQIDFQLLYLTVPEDEIDNLEEEIMDYILSPSSMLPSVSTEEGKPTEKNTKLCSYCKGWGIWNPVSSLTTLVKCLLSLPLLTLMLILKGYSLLSGRKINYRLPYRTLWVALVTCKLLTKIPPALKDIPCNLCSYNECNPQVKSVSNIVCMALMFLYCVLSRIWTEFFCVINFKKASSIILWIIISVHKLKMYLCACQYNSVLYCNPWYQVLWVPVLYGDS